MTIPFVDEEVESAFPEYEIAFPALGVGSFKVAYAATREGETIVLKILTEPLPIDPEEYSEESLPERQGRELRGMAAINSPHIVRLLKEPDARAIGAFTYLYYEEPLYVGGTLRTRLNLGPLTMDETLALARALLLAVKVLWNDHSIVHRDIKPGNIVFDADQLPVLLDLGIALYGGLSDITDSGTTSPKTAMYAAPEQFELRRNAQIDFRTDLFAIGIVLFEALSGRHPYYTNNVALNAYLDRIENFPATALDSTDAPPELRALIMRCLAPRLNRRFRTVEDALAIVEGL